MYSRKKTQKIKNKEKVKNIQNKALKEPLMLSKK